MRMKAVEAMGRGLAVVGTSVGLEGIPGTPGVHFLIPKSEDALAEEIIKILKNPHLLENIGKAGHLFANENYNWQKLVNEFEEFYFALK